MNSTKTILESPAAGTPGVGKRVILSMGRKSSVGKTSALAEWFQENSIPVKLLDLDTENKARGSLTYFFCGQVPKVNIHTPAGLDAFVDELTDGPPVNRAQRHLRKDDHLRGAHRKRARSVRAFRPSRSRNAKSQNRPRYAACEPAPTVQLELQFECTSGAHSRVFVAVAESAQLGF
jgi:hypothetical protein